MKTTPKCKSLTGRNFTLIELLITIAIIAILAAMLLPALNQARDRGKMAKCTSNLKNIGLSAFQYANDNKDFFPLALNRTIPAFRYLIAYDYLDVRLMDCPSDVTRKASTSFGSGDFYPYSWRKYKNTYINQGYLWNIYSGYINPSNEIIYEPWMLGKQKHPSFDHLVFDGDSGAHSNGFYHGVSNGISSAIYDPRHSGQGNVLFADGHTELLSYDRLRYDIYPQSSRESP